MDRYTKFILTVTAVLLALHLVRPWLIPAEVNAQSKIMDVNIAQVGYRAVRVAITGLEPMDSIPVFISGSRQEKKP